MEWSGVTVLFALAIAGICCQIILRLFPRGVRDGVKRKREGNPGFGERSGNPGFGIGSDGGGGD